jgi:hypothetical protein
VVGRASSTVVLPRWVVLLLVGACVAGLVAIAFLLGRVTAPPPRSAATGTVEAGRSAPAASSEATPGDVPAPAGSSGAVRDVPPSAKALESERKGVPDGHSAAGGELAPAPPASGNPDGAAVAAYFARMDAVAAQVKAAQDPEALARTILDQTLSGNMSGFDELIATQRALQARMAEVLPPSSCREHHQRSLRLIARAIALLQRTRDAVAGKEPSALASMATEGKAIEEEAKATDALANDLRRAVGLPVVP